MLATSPDPRTRDGALALRWAKQACQATWYEAPVLLDALAAAYAETGRFGDAADTARQALMRIPPAGESQLCQQIAERLRLYQQGRPYRDDSAAERS